MERERQLRTNQLSWQRERERERERRRRSRLIHDRRLQSRFDVPKGMEDRASMEAYSQIFHQKHSKRIMVSNNLVWGKDLCTESSVNQSLICELTRSAVKGSGLATPMSEQIQSRSPMTETSGLPDWPSRRRSSRRLSAT